MQSIPLSAQCSRTSTTTSSARKAEHNCADLCRCNAQCAAALLSATGPALTQLQCLCYAELPLMEAIAKLTSLRRLSLEPSTFSGITADFGRLKVWCDVHILERDSLRWLRHGVSHCKAVPQRSPSCIHSSYLQL